MSVATHLLQATMWTSTSQGAVPAPLDDDGARDLYAIWQSVFERSRPVEVSQDESYPPSAASTRQLHWQFNTGHDASADGTAPPVRAEAASGITSSESVPVSAARSRPTQQQPDSLEAVAVQVGPGAPDADGSVGSVRHDAARPRSGARPASQAPAAAMSSVAAESLHVFVQEGTVAIVVRDARISEQGALHCAFETARALTGQRAALRQLTLNGRALYQQPPPASTDRALQAATLVFAC
jgi:hypothetical protein